MVEAATTRSILSSAIWIWIPKGRAAFSPESHDKERKKCIRFYEQAPVWRVPSNPDCLTSASVSSSAR
jgi:hypothetical protein